MRRHLIEPGRLNGPGCRRTLFSWVLAIVLSACKCTLLLQWALTCTTDRGDLATLALQVVTWATSHEHIRNFQRPLPHQY
jgi:hypothetical protein